MSRRRPTATAIAALAALVAAPAIPAASLEQIVERGYIRVGVANQRPFGAMTSAGTAEGFGPSIAKKVLDRMGITRIVWKVVPPDALIASLQGERVDAVAAALTITPKRCSKVAFSQPNTSFGQAMLVRTPNPQDIHGYPDFQTRAGLKLGVVAGSQPALLARKLAIADDQLVVLPGAGAAPPGVSTPTRTPSVA